MSEQLLRSACERYLNGSQLGQLTFCCLGFQEHKLIRGNTDYIAYSGVSHETVPKKIRTLQLTVFFDDALDDPWVLSRNARVLSVSTEVPFENFLLKETESGACQRLYLE